MKIIEILKKIKKRNNLTYYLVSFFYNDVGDSMRIYVDLVLFLNFFFDFLLLFFTALLLRRQTNLKRLCLGGGIGSITIFSMFIAMDSLGLFLIKIVVSVLMVLVAYGYRDLRYFGKNLFYLYTSSVILGGFLYLLDMQFRYQNAGLVFYFNGLSVNVVVMVLVSPVVLYFYVKEGLHFKAHYQHYYQVDIYLKSGEVIETTAFLDTGNHLVDPYQRRPILLLNQGLLQFDYTSHSILLVPYESLNHHGLLKCVVPEKIFIQGYGFKKNLLVGISEEKIMIDGVDCIMGSAVLERVI